jgi:hypothetical protein
MVLRSLLGATAAHRAASGKEGAFEDATKFLVSNMLRSFAKKIEACMFYGGAGYGTVSGVVGNVITITTAEFAPGLWIGGENMPLEIRDNAGVLRGTCTVTAVSISARTVTVDALPAGTVATDVIWHKGSYGTEMAGIHTILTNTGSLFGINAANYSLWKSVSVSAGGALSLAVVEKAIAQAVNKGLDADVTVYVNPKAWSDLLTEQAAKRMYDGSYSSTEVQNGAKTIKFYGLNGAISVVASPFVKEGYAYVLCMEDWKKIGSTDITFERPDGEQYFKLMEGAHGYELRAVADLAVFCNRPGVACIITGIVNS